MLPCYPFRIPWESLFRGHVTPSVLQIRSIILQMKNGIFISWKNDGIIQSLKSYHHRCMTKSAFRTLSVNWQPGIESYTSSIKNILRAWNKNISIIIWLQHFSINIGPNLCLKNGACSFEKRSSYLIVKIFHHFYRAQLENDRSFLSICEKCNYLFSLCGEYDYSKTNESY